MNDLSYYTCDELIKELFSRATFAGVLVYLEGDYRGRPEQLAKTSLLRNRKIVNDPLTALLLRSAADTVSDVEK